MHRPQAPLRRRLAAGRSRARLVAVQVIQVGQFFQGGDADVHRVAQGARLGPRLGHADQVRRHQAVHVARRGVAQAGERALLDLHGGVADGHVAVDLVRDLHQGRGDRPQPTLVRQVEQTGVEHERLAVPFDGKFLLHGTLS